MDKEEKETLAKYRIKQAKDEYNDAELLYNAKSYKSANNRAYYAAFHAIKAVLALSEVDFKKHSAVIAYFNQHYISTGIFSKELGKKLSSLTTFREKSDYVDFYIVTREESAEQLKTAKETIDLIEKYLKENNI